MASLIAACSFYDTGISEFLYFLFDRTTRDGEMNGYLV